MRRFTNRMMNHENRSAEGNTDYPEVARHQGRAAKSFTLVELLVVIVIIALLAAMLMPVFSRVRGRAERAQCANNLKQLALAFMAYEGELKEYPTCGSNTWGTKEYWTYAICVKYLGGDANVGWGQLQYPKVMHCPTAVRYSDPPDWVQTRWSYMMNEYLSWLPSTAVTHPSETAMLMDGSHPLPHYWVANANYGSSPFFVHERKGGPRYVPQGGGSTDTGTVGMVNVAFTDGHVAPLKNTQWPMGWANSHFFWAPN